MTFNKDPDIESSFPHDFLFANHKNIKSWAWELCPWARLSFLQWAFKKPKRYNSSKVHQELRNPQINKENWLSAMDWEVENYICA